MGIKIKNIEKTIGDFSLEISLEIKKGELMFLLGPSGSGKSTALLTLAGLLESDTGNIYLNGKDITNLPPHKRNIGLVFQDYALFPHMNVFNNIAYGLKTQKTDRHIIKKRVNKLLDMVHLTGYQDRKISSLSGGEQQRVALARALAPEPELLLLDEPLSAIDAQLRKILRKEIRKIQQELNITTIYVTHDQEEALTISDRIAVLNNGRIEQTGTPEKLYSNPETIFVGRFIGTSNTIEVNIEKTEGKELIVRSITGMKYHLNNNGMYKQGERGWLFFRPEHCEIKGTEYSGKNCFKGIVKTVEYYGSYYQAEIAAEKTIMKFTLPPEIHPESGKQFCFRVNPSLLKILPF